MSREICKACWKPSPVGFSVPDEVWKLAVPPFLWNQTLCIMCFAALADELGIAWDRDIQFWPVSRAYSEGADRAKRANEQRRCR